MYAFRLSHDWYLCRRHLQFPSSSWPSLTIWYFCNAWRRPTHTKTEMLHKFQFNLPTASCGGDESVSAEVEHGYKENFSRALYQQTMQSSARYLCSGRSLTDVLVSTKVGTYSNSLSSNGIFQYFLRMSAEWWFKTTLIIICFIIFQFFHNVLRPFNPVDTYPDFWEPLYR
jgi:hypothetical protein